MNLFKAISRAVLVLGAGIVLTSCATIFTGTTDEISFRSEPAGATIYIDGLEQGTTPATVTVKRPGLGETEVTLEREGYEDKVFTLQSEFNAVSILNFAGLVGWAVDIATGAVKKYSPRGYNMELKPKSTSYKVEDLPRDLKGAYVLSGESSTVTITDSAAGLTYIFEK